MGTLTGKLDAAYKEIESLKATNASYLADWRQLLSSEKGLTTLVKSEPALVRRENEELKAAMAGMRSKAPTLHDPARDARSELAAAYDEIAERQRGFKRRKKCTVAGVHAF